MVSLTLVQECEITQFHTLSSQVIAIWILKFVVFIQWNVRRLQSETQVLLLEFYSAFNYLSEKQRKEKCTEAGKQRAGTDETRTYIS